MDTAQIINLIISLVSGIIGGNAAGAAVKEEKSLGVLGNSIAGLLGGGAGNFILQLLGLFGSSAAGASTADQLNIGTIIGNIAGSGVGGAVLMYIVSLIKNAITKST